LLHLKTKPFRSEYKTATGSSVYTEPRPIIVQGHIVFKGRLSIQSQNSSADTTY